MRQKPRLYVEGPNDLHVVANLLKRHGLEQDARGSFPGRPVIEWAKTETGTDGGVTQLIRMIPTIVKVAEGPVGFILDADPSVGLASRWQAVRHRLAEAGVEAPPSPLAEGFVGYSQASEISVGAWLMPDNQRDGVLESFLLELIDEGDALIKLAQSSTAAAANIDCRFRKPDILKAELHTWLAWQATPGVPYGTGIGSHYFRVDSPSARAFVAWVRSLCNIQEDASE